MRVGSTVRPWDCWNDFTTELVKMSTGSVVPRCTVVHSGREASTSMSSVTAPADHHARPGFADPAQGGREQAIRP